VGAVDWALQILLQIAAALDAAHAKGLVHRDVKPANVLIDPGAGAGGRDHVYLTDFGLARPAIGASPLTKAGEIYGTIDYMPPEQLSGGVVDARSDIYAFGCLAYECFTGAPPFRRDTMLATAAAQMHEEPTPPSRVRPELPSALDAELARGLAKEKANRPRTAFDLVEAVSVALLGPSVTGGPPADSGPIGGARQSRKNVTVAVVQVDVEASEDPDPELLRAVESRVEEETRAAFRLRNAMVEATLEGAILAVLGVPELHEDDARRAVEAAFEARDKILGLAAEFDTPVSLAFRCGISTGTVVVDEPVTRASTMSGPVVPTASRIRAAGSPGDVLIDAATYRLARSAVSAEPLEPSPVANTLVYRVHEPRTGSLAPTELAPFVGRSRELAMLRQALEHAIADRACHVFTILGPAGVGKSRLLSAFVDEAREQAGVIRGRCLSYGRGITYWPLVEMVREAAGITDGDSRDRALERVSEVLGEEEDRTLAERVGGLIGLAESVGSPQEAFAAVRRFFEVQARRRPIVLVFEDLHWAEPALLDLIEHVADLTSDAPLLIVCPAREELVEARPGWGGGRFNTTSILLEPLDETESTELVTLLMNRAPLPPAVQAKLTLAAGGNPLFVEQLVRALIDEGLVVEGPAGGWVVTGDVTGLSIPPTIQALLAARLDRLGAPEREPLGCGAVEGLLFHAGSVRTLLESDGDGAVEPEFASLTRKGLIRHTASEFAGEEAFRFRHQLIRDAAYEAVRKEDRAKFHARFADWLRARVGARAFEYDEILGSHLEAAFGYRSELGHVTEADRELAAAAAGLLGAAGRRALARSDVPAAANLLSRARELVLDGVEERLDLGVALSDALIELGQLERAGEVLDETIAAAGGAGDSGREARARVLRSFLRGHRDDPVGWTEEALGEAQAAIAVFRQEGDAFGLARAYELVAEAQWGEHAYAEAEAALENGLEAARAAGDTREEAKILAWLPAAYFWGPTPVDEAVNRCRGVLELARDDRAVTARCQLLLAGLQGMRGEFDPARELFAESRATLEELGMAQSVASGTHVSGMVEMLAGEWATAEREYRAGFGFFEAAGDTGYLVVSASFLARAVYEQGRLAEAEELTRLVERTAASDDDATRADWAGTRAKILAARGEIDAAEALAREAVSVYARTGELRDHADALADLAEVLHRAGQDVAASRMLVEAVDLYARKGVLPSISRARARLEELSTERGRG
jgi:tetratricopeptide (TPR) repeat protein